jgi:PAS domain S-box-containing protein
MASYAAFFYVYSTALLVLEVLVGIAFAVRSFAESSRKMAILAMAYAWTAPMIVLNIVDLPGVPPDLPGDPLQVAPANWILWHVGWPLFIAAYAWLPERADTRAIRLIPVAFVASLAANISVIALAAHLPTLIGPGERIEPLFHGLIAIALALNLVVIARLARSRPTPRDRWVAAAVAFAALEAALMLAADVRFHTLFFAARIAGLASACAMLATVVVDAFGVVRRGAQQVAEGERMAEFRVIADAMPQIVWRISADNRNVYTNRRWIEYTGRERVAGADPGFLDAIHPDDLAARNAAFAAARDAAAPYEATYRVRGADGIYRYFLTRAVPIVQNGRVTEWIGTSTDIDDRRRNELEQRTAYERELRDAGRMRMLASIGRALSQSLDLELVLSTAVSAPVPDIADWAIVNLRNDAGELVVAAVHHRDEARAARARQLIGNSYVVTDTKGGSHEVVANVTTGLRAAEVTDELLRATIAEPWLDLFIALEPRSSVVVPLVCGDTVRGTLIVVYAESGRTYQPEDLEMLEEIGRRVALAIENAEFYAREHRVADRLQRASLPASLPRLPGIALDAVYQAGQSEARIGGDWYDAFELDDGRLVVGVGDVMGSGLEAAVTMSAVRQAIRGAAEVLADPATILDAADRSLTKVQADALVTAFLGIIDRGTSTITYASAGHPPPFVRHGDGSVEKLAGSGLPIGLRRGQPADAPLAATLDDDAFIVLYTDGLTEANRDIADGEARLCAALGDVADAERPATAIRTRVLDALEPHDDIAILTVRLTRVRVNGVTAVRCDVRDRDDVRRVRHAVTEALERFGCSEEAVFDGDLVLGELLGNVVRHAPPIADVRLDLRGPAPRLSVLDRGAGCPPFLAEPDLQRESGRGLYLISQVVTDLTITARDGGGSEIQVTLRVS